MPVTGFLISAALAAAVSAAVNPAAVVVVVGKAFTILFDTAPPGAFVCEISVPTCLYTLPSE